MKIGILCEDYKKEIFENKLKENNLEFKSMPFQKGIIQIHIECDKNDIDTIHSICNEVNKSLKK